MKEREIANLQNDVSVNSNISWYLVIILLFLITYIISCYSLVYLYRTYYILHPEKVSFNESWLLFFQYVYYLANLYRKTFKIRSEIDSNRSSSFQKYEMILALKTEEKISIFKATYWIHEIHGKNLLTLCEIILKKRKRKNLQLSTQCFRMKPTGIVISSFYTSIT